MPDHYEDSWSDLPELYPDWWREVVVLHMMSQATAVGGLPSFTVHMMATWS